MHQLKRFIPCVIFHIKASLRAAVNLCNLGCSPSVGSPHEQCALLHTPGHVVISCLLKSAGEGPGAGGGAELLAAVTSIRINITTAGEETLQGVVLPPLHQAGQLARGGGGGVEHLRGVTGASRDQEGCGGSLYTSTIKLNTFLLGSISYIC